MTKNKNKNPNKDNDQKKISDDLKKVIEECNKKQNEIRDNLIKCSNHINELLNNNPENKNTKTNAKQNQTTKSTGLSLIPPPLPLPQIPSTTLFIPTPPKIIRQKKTNNAIINTNERQETSKLLQIMENQNGYHVKSYFTPWGDNNVTGSYETRKPTTETEFPYFSSKEYKEYSERVNIVDYVKHQNKLKRHYGITKEDIDEIEVKEVNIEVEIETLDDMIELINNNPLRCPQTKLEIKYNIDMKAIHGIKEPLIELSKMIGMKGLKKNIVDQILYFVQGLHKTQDTDSKKHEDFMHTVIYGPPGTGKTEIAKIMGSLFSKLGVLKKGTFTKATRSDLIAGYLGQTAIKTREMVEKSLGGVLFIDEAYALGNPEKRDSFAKECIDTLCELLSNHKDELMVIIAGYKQELKKCFFGYNQGLDSRFTWRFKTDDYSPEELCQIFLKKIKDIGWSVEEDEKEKKPIIKTKWFEDNKDYFKFYGRDMETLLSKTKIAHSRRVFCLPDNKKRIISLKDLDKGLKMYLENEEVKNRKETKDIEKRLMFSMYS